jgi:hypothetical protein
VPVAHTCNPSYSGGRNQEDHSSKSAQDIVHETLSLKQPIQKRADGVAQVVECLSSKHEILSSNCNTTKKKKKNKKLRLETWLKWWSACLTSGRLRSTPAPQNWKKKKRNYPGYGCTHKYSDYIARPCLKEKKVKKMSLTESFVFLDSRYCINHNPLFILYLGDCCLSIFILFTQNWDLTLVLHPPEHVTRTDYRLSTFVPEMEPRTRKSYISVN